jgi:hypothetical protein
MAQSQSIIDIRLNVGNAISDAHALEDALKSVGKAMDQAVLAGDSNAAKSYGQLQGMLRDQYRRLMDEQNPGSSQSVSQTRTGNSFIQRIRGVNQFINSGTNIIGGAGSGNAAGAALGAASSGAQLAGALGGVSTGVLAGVGIASAVIGLIAGANKLSEQWEKVMQPSMALTASLGRLSENADRNSQAFQETFAQATNRNILHGYTNEEGIALANQLSKMGASNVFGGEEQVFRYQRDTDASRDTLAQAVGLSQRYNLNENVLGFAYGGTQQSGMKPGQYQEYLNATLRIFEEGLSRGVVKGFGEITRTQNMLAQIGETWKGERGVEKYQRMTDVVSGAGNLESDYDVVLYKAMQDVMTAAGSKMGDANSYVDVMKQLDKGLTPELLDATMKRLYATAGESRENTIVQAKQLWELSATSADELYNFWRNGQLSNAVSTAVDPTSKGAESNETKLLGATNEIAANVALIGSNFLPAKTAIVDSIAKLTNVMAGERAFQSYKENNRGTIQDLGLTDSEVSRVNRLFNEAYTKKNQPDVNGNMMGDYGENAMAMQRSLEGLPVDVRYKIAMDPELQRTLFTGISRVEDFTENNVAEFQKRLEEIVPLPYMAKSSAKGLRLGSQYNNSFNEAIDQDNPYAMAYARSVKERWGGNMPQYRESDEYRFVEDYIRRKGRDGLDPAETEEMFRQAVSRSAGTRSMEEYAENENKSMYTNNVIQRVSDYGSSEYSELMTILGQNHSQLTFAKMREIMEPAMGRNTDDGGNISNTEIRGILAAMRELIPALRENTVTTVELH